MYTLQPAEGGRGMSIPETIEVSIKGMDCVSCAKQVQGAIATRPGIASVEVLLAAEKAVVQLDPARVDLAAIRKAVEGAGYSVPAPASQRNGPHTIEVPIRGMDCMDCAQQVQRAIAALPGVQSANVLLSAEK